MDGWRLTFNFKDGANAIDLELVGNAQAIQMGLGLAALTMGDKLRQRMASKDTPVVLLQEVSKLFLIQQGAAITEHEGEFLHIAPVKQVSGLTQSLSVEWGD